MNATTWDISAIPAPDRYAEATRYSHLACLITTAVAVMFFVVNPNLFISDSPVADPELISVEYMEFSPPAPDPLMLPEDQIDPYVEPDPTFEPDPIIEPDEFDPLVEPDPFFEPEPEPSPNPVLKKEIPKPKKAPPKAKPEAKAAPAAAQASAPARQSAPNFVSDFVKVVQRCKFYPKSARQAGITGTVKVRVSFDGQGGITNYSLVPGDYHASLGEGAMATMAKVKSRWQPKGGGPSSLIVPIAFRIN